MELSKLFTLIPIEIVNNILSYDNRFVIRSGKIIKKIDKEKYAKIYALLLGKPQIRIIRSTNNSMFWSEVEFQKFKITVSNDDYEMNDGAILHEHKCIISNKGRYYVDKTIGRYRNY